ncbi:transcriptional regulator [Desemzia sp. C1]|uniref:transcriptional regulator n=1 Tax=Desemzia sp. C1 TaxID=2892016 RepID=UPI001E3D8563|nr:transcriptional regulator [Desemzia sp. C1]MCI3029758.1 transcriptional regulator [Desemzia sp. C1]
MKKSTFKNIETILHDYPDYGPYIAHLEEGILYPSTLQDENIGGGKSGFISKPTEQKVLTIADDRRIRNLTLYKNTIDRLLFQSDEETKTIIKEYYFRNPRILTLSDIASKCHSSERTCVRLRDKFFDRVADELGFMK